MKNKRRKQSDKPHPRAIEPEAEKAVAPESSSFLNVLLASTAKRSSGEQISDDFQRVLPPARRSVMPNLAPVVTRAWEGLKKNRNTSADKQLLVPPPAGRSILPSFALMGAKAWEWLKKNRNMAAKKQLRVSDTVGLGEKRFVALLHFEGRKFLIGGGASSVSLLTELGDAPAGSVAMPSTVLSGSAE